MVRGLGHRVTKPADPAGNNFKLAVSVFNMHDTVQPYLQLLAAIVSSQHMLDRPDIQAHVFVVNPSLPPVRQPDGQFRRARMTHPFVAA